MKDRNSIKKIVHILPHVLNIYELVWFVFDVTHKQQKSSAKIIHKVLQLLYKHSKMVHLHFKIGNVYRMLKRNIQMYRLRS